jgi:LSD1 subclass zinc finger protein
LIQAAVSSEYPVLVANEIRLPIGRPDTIPESAVEVIGVPELTLPRRSNIAALVAGGTRLTAAGAAWIGLGNGEFRAKVLSEREVVLALLAHHGITARPSAWAAAADRTLALLGGMSGVEPLASDGALHVIDLLAERGPYQRSGSGRPRPEALESLPLATIASRLAGKTPFGTKAAAGPLVDALVRANIVFPGLRAKCGRCDADYWRVIDDIRSEMVCSGCRTPIRFSLMPPGRSSEEAPWEYRLNEVLVWPLDQGVIPGLLAMRRMRRDAVVRARLVFGQTLSGPGITGELDVVGALDRDPVVSEVKLGPSMNSEEIKLTMATAERIRGIAYFATTAIQWDAATVALLAEAIAARPNLPVRQLLRSDLVA